VSPWTRGGYVASEVFDHTSTVKFLETWAAHLARQRQGQGGGPRGGQGGGQGRQGSGQGGQGRDRRGGAGGNGGGARQAPAAAPANGAMADALRRAGLLEPGQGGKKR
ncbi:hypothetical protein, partial [Streptomyces sp. NPDC001743]|uniref:hypothetical protein n=1 Tax=Streptomyces sp. NPDC001743 TaxID=3154397 RepID=UPI00331A2FD5